jgi:hypothetical protein
MTRLLDQVREFSFPDGKLHADFRPTYFALRFGVGIIGVLLPLILVGWGLYRGIAWSDMTALSAFYWLRIPGDPTFILRNWFVGSLSAVGIGLIVYKGYGRLENQLLNLAGLALVSVALNPMAWPQVYEPRLPVHEIVAFIFFGMISATIWFCSGKTLVGSLKQEVRVRWMWIYRIFAIAMVAFPLGAYLLARREQRLIFVEVLGVWVFASYWFVKIYEVSRVSMVEPPSGPAPNLRWTAGRLEMVSP